MSIVAVHGPNTMFTTEGGGTAIASTPAGATATKDPTNGLKYSFSFPNPGARPAGDFDWTFTGPGSPAAQADKLSGTVTFTGAGAGTIVCTVAAGAGPPAGGTYTITVAPTAGVPKELEEGEEPPADTSTESLEERVEDLESSEVPVGFDPSAHTVAEVEAYADGLETAEEVQTLIDAETAGKNRTTLISYLESMLPYDPAEHTVAEVEEYASEHPDEAESILSSEREGKNRTTLVAFLESLTAAE